MTTGGLRAERLARLGRLLDAQGELAAEAGHDIRHRIDRLLDRDAPFLELAPLAPGPVTGIGLVADTGCVVTAGGPEGASTPKAMRAGELAAGCGLPLLALDDDPATPVRLRQEARYGPGAASAGPASGAAPFAPPRPDADGLLDAAGVADVLDHVLDGSRFDPWAGTVPAGVTAGWGAVGGLPVAVEGRDGAAPEDGPDGEVEAFRDVARAAGTPLVRLAVDGASATLAVSGPGAAVALRFSWPGVSAEDTGDDGAIDPRDSRAVLAIARWCVGPR